MQKVTMTTQHRGYSYLILIINILWKIQAEHPKHHHGWPSGFESYLSETQSLKNNHSQRTGHINDLITKASKRPYNLRLISA